MRYNSGLHFLAPELWGLTEAAVRLRKNGESTLPETASTETPNRLVISSFLPQWLICRLPSKTAIDRVRLVLVDGTAGHAAMDSHRRVGGWTKVDNDRGQATKHAAYCSRQRQGFPQLGPEK